MLSPHSASAAVPDSTAAHWEGTVEFDDCPDIFCFRAHTDGALDVCYDTVGVGNLQATLQGCEAAVAKELPKLVAGGRSVCAAVGSSVLHYTDYIGTTLPITVMIVVSNGVMVIQGRYVDAAGRELYSVYASAPAPCNIGTARWSGTLTAYNY